YSRAGTVGLPPPTRQPQPRRARTACGCPRHRTGTVHHRHRGAQPMNTNTEFWHVDMQREVRLSLGDHADDFDLEGIMHELVAAYGVVHPDTIPARVFWAVV